MKTTLSFIISIVLIYSVTKEAKKFKKQTKAKKKRKYIEDKVLTHILL